MKINIKEATLESEWESYFNKCYPHPVTEMQRLETQQAFFAGCVIAFGMVCACSEELSEDEAVFKLSALTDEAKAFLISRLAAMTAKQN